MDHRSGQLSTALYAGNRCVRLADYRLAYIVDDIRRDDGISFIHAGLRSFRLTFKRVQRLRFNDKPLVQIVYLPEKGFAGFAMRDDR